jgi:hypothetical protein
MKTDKLLQVLTQGPQKAQGRLLPLPKAQTGRNILYVDPDDPEGMARYKAAQDSAAAYNSPFQALKALETWQKNPTEKNAQKYKDLRNASHDWAASSELRHIPHFSNARGFKFTIKDTPDNTPDGNKDYLAYYEKPVQEVILSRPDVKPMIPIGFSQYEPELQQREGVTPQMLSGIEETISMPSGVQISKKDFIKQYGQGAWDRATNKKEGGPLPTAQAGLKKYTQPINPVTGKPFPPQGIEVSPSPLDLIGAGSVVGLLRGAGALAANLVNRAHPADRGWMNHWANWAVNDIANTSRKTYEDAKDLYNQEMMKVNMLEKGQKTKREGGPTTDKLRRVLIKHQGTEASQTGSEEPIRTIMDPRYQQQSSPVPYWPSINTGLNQNQPAQQPNLTLNPNWKEGDDPNTKWMIDLPTVEGETLYSFPTCIGGLCYDMASDLGQGVDEFKKRNNVIGNAWNIIDTAFGENIDYNPNDFTNLKVGDIVALSRGKRATDRERGITSESEQHMGRISKIENGIPYVKHYMPGIEGKGTKDNTEKSYGRYLEEPINNIGEATKYTPSRVKRLPDYKELNLQPSTFNFDQNYKPNQIEQQMLTAMKEKPFLQEILALDNNEYDDLEKLAYGILYNEGKFGRSEKTLYRMAVPDFVQKLVKQGQDIVRGTNNYDDNINNLSQGYGSIKESTLHGVSQTDINEDKSNKLSTEEVNRRVKQGDFSNLERTNNYLYEAMREMGLNPDNLENGGNSFKAVMATLAWYKKRFPNATDDQLIQKFLGKKNITKYKNNMDNAYRNIDRNASNNQEYSFMDELYGNASGLTNTVYEGLKDVRSNVVSTARDYSGMPLMVKGILGDVLGGREPITNATLNSDQMSALTNIVRNQINSGKNYLDYNAYFPDLSRGERLEVSGGVGDEGGGSSKTEKLERAMSPEGQLQNTFGQASIVPLGNNRYMVTDTYDFNDQGKSFGLIDDLKRRGPDPYSVARSVGRNYGSMDEQGAPVRIIVDLNEKKQGGSYTPKKTLKVRIKKPK